MCAHTFLTEFLLQPREESVITHILQMRKQADTDSTVKHRHRLATLNTKVNVQSQCLLEPCTSTPHCLSPLKHKMELPQVQSLDQTELH